MNMLMTFGSEDHTLTVGHPNWRRDMPRRISMQIGGWVEDYLETHAGVDQVKWEMNQVFTPENFMAQILFFMDSPLLGNVIVFPIQINNLPLVKQEDVDEICQKALLAMRQARSEQLAAPLNGQVSSNEVDSHKH